MEREATAGEGGEDSFSHFARQNIFTFAPAPTPNCYINITKKLNYFLGNKKILIY